MVHEDSCHILVCGGCTDPNHDAVMRIGSELRSGGPILNNGIEAMGRRGTPPPRTIIGDRAASCADKAETVNNSLQ